MLVLSNLRWNKLQDVIPPEIGELKRLTHLWVIWTFWGYLVMFGNLFILLRYNFNPKTSAATWVSITLKGKFPRSLRIFLNFSTSIYMKIVSLGGFHQNWALYKTSDTCNILCSLLVSSKLLGRCSLLSF